MSLSEELANVISKIVDAAVDEKLKILEDTHYAKSKQTKFTMVELAERWGCSKVTVDRILKENRINPVGKRGKNHEFELEQAEVAKSIYDEDKLNQHELNKRVRAM